MYRYPIQSVLNSGSTTTTVHRIMFHLFLTRTEKHRSLNYTALEFTLLGLSCNVSILHMYALNRSNGMFQSFKILLRNNWVKIYNSGIYSPICFVQSIIITRRLVSAISPNFWQISIDSSLDLSTQCYSGTPNYVSQDTAVWVPVRRENYKEDVVPILPLPHPNLSFINHFQDIPYVRSYSDQ